jgi:hypothetical protein
MITMIMHRIHRFTWLLIATIVATLLLPSLALAAALQVAEDPHPGSLNNAALWALVVGFLQAPLQAIIQRPTWSDATRSIITFALSFALAGMQLFFEGALTESLAVGDYVRTFLVTFVAAQAFYRVFWKPSTITTVIEEKTSPTPKTAHRIQAVN